MVVWRDGAFKLDRMGELSPLTREFVENSVIDNNFFDKTAEWVQTHVEQVDTQK